MTIDDLGKWLQAIWDLLNQIFDSQAEMEQDMHALRHELEALSQKLEQHLDK